MDYHEATEWLFSQLPIYQRQGKLAYKPDLRNIEELCELYGDPQKSFPSVHIAGTNGKGSTAHIIASILQEAGYKVGLHTQPHFLDLRERIRVNGIPCPEAFIAEKVTDYYESAPDIAPSFFELILAFAFQHFAEEDVDIAVIETGMGGRLDATNIIDPELAVITNIGHDHMRFLGNDLATIAGEKAGIIKDEKPLILGNIPADALPVIESKAREKGAPIRRTGDEPVPPSDLQGVHQEQNIRTALKAIEELVAQGWKIPKDAQEKGLQRVVPNTGFMGRWQLLGKDPLVIADMGHNQEALAATWKALKDYEYRKLHLVFGSVNDKDWGSSLQGLPERCEIHLCRPDVPRGMSVEELGERFARQGHTYSPHESVEAAYGAALENAASDDIILVGGSTFVVAEFLAKQRDLSPEE